MNWLHRILLHNKIYHRFIAWTRAAVIPGFGTLSIYEIVSSFINDFFQGDLINKASALAYNFLLAFFPGMLFLLSLIAYIPVKYNFQRQLLDIISSILPTNAYLALNKTIDDIVVKQNGKLLSFGVIAALYFATNGVSNLMRAFNHSSLIIEKRSWLKRRIIATALTVVISIALLVALVIMIAGEWLIHLLQNHLLSGSHFWVTILPAFRWLIIIVIFFFTVSLLYRYGPSHKLKWAFLNPGSILATGLALLTSWGFAFYINHFSSYNKLYGSIGTLIVVMIWMYLNSLILLIGFELNADIDLSKRSIRVVKQRYNTFREQNTEV